MCADELTAETQVWRLRGSALSQEQASLIREEPLEIVVDSEPYATLMRTPGDDIALVAGFCLAEGLVESGREIGAIAHCGGDPNRVVVTRAGAGAPPQRRRLPVASSCGLCGREMIGELTQHLPRSLPPCVVSVRDLFAMAVRMEQEQKHFRLTGGTHSAAIFDEAGDLLAFGEDIGRHNALDKAVGRLLLSNSLDRARVAVLSGRCSFEMVQKAARAGIPVAASVSAPTHLAVELARELGATLVGFLREANLTVYVDQGRITNLNAPA